MARARARSGDPLATYKSKRRFDETPEPEGRKASKPGKLYTIQKHAARRLHYDLRLELDGVLKSWAITRGPSLDPSEKRLSVRTEDHPVDYAEFEGRIPEGNYGAGTVLLWDRGTWEPVGDPHKGLDKGKLVFDLHGERLHGRWALVRFRGSKDERRENWLLVKEVDTDADREHEVTEDYRTSVLSDRDIDAIADAPEAVWSNTGKKEVGEGNPKKNRAKRSRSGKLAKFVEPALATLVDDIPEGENWIFEVKFDGYRAISAVSGDEARIYTRSGLDWTDRFSRIADALGKLDLDGVLLDGEVVALDEDGHSDFSRLQRALKGEGSALSYFVFDLLAEGGKSLRKEPLLERKERLRKLLDKAGRTGPVFFTDHVERDGATMLDELCDAGYEGVIAKRADKRYRSGRGRAWLKIKCKRDQEFVIVGWSPSDKDRPLASLLLGVHEDGDLRYAGRVGTGFTEDELVDLRARLDRIARKTSPVDGDIPTSIAKDARWVRPNLVAQIGFAEFTRKGLVRQARFLGLREDKDAKDVGRDRASRISKVQEMSEENTDKTTTIAGVRLTNPDKVLFPEQGVTKRHLADYFDRMAGRILDHAANRLISLVRCPSGHDDQCFFQRHGGSGLPDQFKTIPVRQKDGKTNDYLYVTDSSGLVAAAQMGVLELHIWGSRIDDIERPDRLVFDLDPSEELNFGVVKDAALRIRDVLEALGLTSFPLVTGGKGIHVVAPLVRRHEWPVVKAFAEAVARRMAEDQPDRYVAVMSKAKRKGRIFIDYLRNERGGTAIAPYSPRARKGAPVAWPIDWDDLGGVKRADQFRLAEVSEDDARGWAGYDDVRQGLKNASLAAVGVDVS